MAKKRLNIPQRKRRTGTFDPESSRWFTPIVFVIFLIALVFLFSDFVFSDLMLYGSDTLQAGYFMRAFYIDYFLEHGSVPQWMPHNFGGLPYVEAFHGDIFYPLTALKFVLPLHRALGWGLFLHIFLAGICMYFAARQFRLSKIASLFAAASYMFAGYLVSLVHPGHDGKIFVTALYPLVILFLERGFKRQPLLNFSLLGLVIGLIILTPHPQMAYFTLWSLAFYAVFKLWVLWREHKSIAPLIKPSVLTAYAVAIGLALSAIQFYPGVLYTNNFSPRADSKKGWEWATSWSLHEEEAMSILIPEFAGTTSRKATTYYWGKNYFKDNAETVGAVPFFIALLGLLFCRRRESYFFGGLALFALVYALGATTPIFRLFYWLIPKVSSLRAPSMIMFIFSFSIALLGAMGIQKVIDVVKGNQKFSERFNYFLFGFPAFMLLLAFLFSAGGKGMISTWCSIFYSEAPTTMFQQGVSKLDVAYANLPAIQSGAWFAFLFTAIAVLGIWLFRSGKAGLPILLGLVAIPMVDGVRFDSRFVDMVAKADFDARFKSGLIANTLQGIDGKFRVINFQDKQSNKLPYFGVDVVIGYHGNQLRWYDELLGGPGIKNMNPPNVRLLNLIGTKYMIIPAGSRLPENYFGEKPLVVVTSDGREQLVRNDNAYPRVFLVDSCRVFADRSKLMSEVLSGSDDLHRVVYLEEEPSLTVLPDSTRTDSAWIIDYQVDSVLVGVEVASNEFLVMTDNYFDAWQVTIDDRPARLLRADGAFRAVEIPAGSRQVLFKYRSSRYLTGRLVTWLTSIYLVFTIGFLVLRGRQKRSKMVLAQNSEIGK